MRKWMAAIALMLAPAVAHATERTPLDGDWTFQDTWGNGGSWSPNLFGCSLDGSSCHFIEFQSAMIKRVGATDAQYASVTGYRWRSEHLFSTPGFYTSPVIDVRVLYAGGMPLEFPQNTPTPWSGVFFSQCLDPLALCEGLLVEPRFTSSTPWYGGNDMLRVTDAYIDVGYEDGRTERIVMRRTNDGSLMAILPEPSSFALVGPALIALVSATRRRRVG